MKRLRFYLILAACVVVVIGLLGPAAFVESKGRLSLHELTFAARSANIPNPDIYMWLSLFFVVLILFIISASYFRKYKITGALSFVGIAVWSISVVLFHQWRVQELDRLKSFADTNTFEYFAYSVFLKGLNLQWGVYSILIGVVLVLFLALVGLKSKT